VTDERFLMLDSIKNSVSSSKRNLADKAAADKGVLAMVIFLISCRTPFCFLGLDFYSLFFNFR
jgi:uncharacterized membrane protein